MTTVILTIIGILLAAASALMVMYFGGDAFGAGGVKARANALQNVGGNVTAAEAGYAAETGASPAALAQLTTSGLLRPLTAEGSIRGE